MYKAIVEVRAGNAEPLITDLENCSNLDHALRYAILVDGAKAAVRRSEAPCTKAATLD